jgi:hypothetical protein
MGTWQFPELTEASGMAYSRKWADLAYTGNDEAGPTYAVDLSTGKKLGSASISGVTLTDPESFDIDLEGTLWRFDIGDNAENRSHVSAYSHREFGPNSIGSVGWIRYDFTYQGGPRNAETGVCWPNGKIHIVDKRASGSVFEFTKTRGSTPALKRIYGPNSDLAFVSDAVASKDGKWVFVIMQGQLDKVFIFTSRWADTGVTIPMPAMLKPEGICIKKDGKGLWVCDDKGGTGGKFQQVKIPQAYWPVTKPYTPPPVTSPPVNPCAA